MESDATFSSDDDTEARCSSASATSSSLPSPEIFRKESRVEALTLSAEEELPCCNVHTTNSTSLDASHAESIHVCHPPNRSTIVGNDASAILAEKNCETNQHRRPEAETKIHTDSCKSDKAFKRKPPPKVANGRSSLCKKVSFSSPIIAETFGAERAPAATLTVHNTGERVQTSSPAEQMMPEADASREGCIHPKDKALKRRVTLERPVKGYPKKAKVFDFVSDSDGDALFQRMRERCATLRSAPLFPLRAIRHTQPSALCTAGTQTSP